MTNAYNNISKLNIKKIKLKIKKIVKYTSFLHSKNWLYKLKQKWNN